jgi:hypothetical protein
MLQLREAVGAAEAFLKLNRRAAISSIQFKIPPDWMPDRMME